MVLKGSQNGNHLLGEVPNFENHPYGTESEVLLSAQMCVNASRTNPPCARTVSEKPGFEHSLAPVATAIRVVVDHSGFIQRLW